ncbi:Zinc finger BED domain-containing protein 4 [Folsomia candida]|uniref:Zinc finger BED domain-containing protein 4 n=1 Tax=Folsomia candida TaxID=158441 RepID=A0A226DUC9_FOLCA|nr:Zinc finger BED domain-containing protein 4 [Folsomia candida]
MQKVTASSRVRTRDQEIGESMHHQADVCWRTNGGSTTTTNCHRDVSLEQKSNVESHSLSEFFNNPSYSDTDPLQKKFVTNLQDLVSVDGFPLSFVSGLGFSNLIHEINPRLNIPSRWTVSRNLQQTVIPALIMEIKAVENYNLHLSTDIWTSKRGDGIMGLKAHYIKEIDGRWEIVTSTLSVRQFNDRHTAENVKLKLMECLAYLDISTEKIGYLVTDGAHNMVSAFRDWLDDDELLTSHEDDEGNLATPDLSTLDDDYVMETDDRYDIENDPGDEQILDVPLGLVFRISCYAHKLQLVAKDAINQNPKSQKILKGVHGIELIKPAPTRWNSNFYVLKRLTEETVYETVSNLILEAWISPRRPKNVPEIPTMQDMEILVELRNLLSPITEATNALQADGITSCLIYYQVVSTFDEIAKIKTKHFTPLKSQLLQQLIRRFVNVACNGVTKLETPTADTATNFLRMLIYPNGPPENTCSIPAPNVNDPFSKLASITYEPGFSSDEVDRYLALPRIPSSSNPLEFWAQNKVSFPKLSKLAQQFLAIPASTGGAERLFSSTGSLGRARRSSLLPITLENMVLHKQHRLSTLAKKTNDRQKSRKRKIATGSSPSKNMRNEKEDEIVFK